KSAIGRSAEAEKMENDPRERGDRGMLPKAGFKPGIADANTVLGEQRVDCNHGASFSGRSAHQRSSPQTSGATRGAPSDKIGLPGMHLAILATRDSALIVGSSAAFL